MSASDDDSLSDHLSDNSETSPPYDEHWPYYSLNYDHSEYDEFEELHFYHNEVDWTDFNEFVRQLEEQFVSARTALEQFQHGLPDNDFVNQDDIDLEEDRLEQTAWYFEEQLENIEGIQNEVREVQYNLWKRAKKGEQERPEQARNELAMISILPSASRPTNLREAWQRKDHEAVVQLASRLIEGLASAPAHYDLDGVRQLCATLRYRFKAYEAMNLYALAVADANRILELLAEFGDVDVEVDESLLPVPASNALEPTASDASTSGPSKSDTPTNSFEEERQWLRGVQHGQKRSASDVIGAKIVKRKKGGNRRLVRSSPHFIKLPVEIVLSIAEHLEAADRIRLANTRQEWRAIPQLWQSLEFNRVKRVSQEGWHRDTIDACLSAIETCQRRSHGTLSRVVLKGFLTSHTVGPILEALRERTATLKHLAIPTTDQAQCFDQLYKRCANLEGIDIRFKYDKKEGYCALHGMSTTHGLPPPVNTSAFSSKKLPFTLKTLISKPDIDCGDLALHMEGIQVVIGMKHQRQKQLNFIDAIQRAAPTLIEWRDDPEDKWDNTTVLLGDYGVGQEQLPTGSIVFPKLRVLSGLWAEHFIDCSFPVLEEARLNSMRGPSSLHPVSQNDQLRIATIITKSPSLKKLDILLPSGYSAVKQIFTAVSDLSDLEELGLWSSNTLSLQALVEAQQNGEDQYAPGRAICPKLHTLRLHTRSVSMRFERELERELSEVLLLRFYLTKGCTFSEAKTRTQAALVAYNKKGNGMTKAQKKKMLNTTATSAAGSSYAGNFVTTDGNKQETFTSVLPKLILTRGMTKLLLEGSQSLLNQLIFETSEVDTSKDFEAFNNSRYQ